MTVITHRIASVFVVFCGKCINDELVCLRYLWEIKMKRMNWTIAALVASAGILATAVIAQDKNGAASVENNAPMVNGIPGESIQEGGKFAPIKLDSYVSDDMDKPAQLKWSVSGNKSRRSNQHTHLPCTYRSERKSLVEKEKSSYNIDCFYYYTQTDKNAHFSKSCADHGRRL